MTGGVGLLEICGKQLQSPCVQSVSPVPADLHVVSPNWTDNHVMKTLACVSPMKIHSGGDAQ